MGLRNWEVHSIHLSVEKSDGLSTAVDFMINDEPHYKAFDCRIMEQAYKRRRAVK